MKKVEQSLTNDRPDESSRRQENRPLSLREYAFQEIRQQILSNKIAPGEPLVINRLAAELGISRTPVRESIHELAKTGLAELVPHKAAFATSYNTRDIEEIFQIRIALEVLAVELAIDQIPAEELKTLDRKLLEAEDRLEIGDAEPHIISDTYIHELILQYTTNQRLTYFVEELQDQLLRIRIFSAGRGIDHLRKSHSEHHAILKALQQRDGSAAREAMETHLRQAGQRIIELRTSENVTEQE